MHRPVGASIVELSLGLQGMDALDEVGGVQHGSGDQIITLVGLLLSQASDKCVGTRFQEHNDTGAVHDGAVPLVHDYAAAGGDHLVARAGNCLQCLPLNSPKFLLAMPREDVLDGHPLRRDNQVVGIDELPAEQSRDLMPGRRLAGPGEACDEYVFSAQWSLQPYGR